MELVPEEIRHHRSVRAWCRRFGRKPDEAVLDVSYMRSAMKGLPDAERRGRPDIVHYFLLSVMEGPAGQEGLVD
ncbi:TPA: 16S rRNA methyltransferase, partial [Candidatus Micrarchaeota archaeon]|nr:16S rRNA methyltransferase [Candidatus Micrarchaeota archaeon]